MNVVFLVAKMQRFRDFADSRNNGGFHSRRQECNASRPAASESGPPLSGQDTQLPPRLTLMPVRQPPPDGETHRKTTMKLAPREAPHLASELITQTRKGSVVRKAKRPHDDARTTRRGLPGRRVREFFFLVYLCCP